MGLSWALEAETGALASVFALGEVLGTPKTVQKGLKSGCCSFLGLRLTKFAFDQIFSALSDTPDSMKPVVLPEDAI